MRQIAHRLDLVFKALNRPIVHHELWMHDLNGDRLAEIDVVGQIYGAHSAVSEQAHDRITTVENLADHGIDGFRSVILVWKIS
jgi:hypothetical protein